MALRCLVIGAGTIGTSVAYRLAGAGADVELIDAVGPAAGTSGTTFAWVGASSLGLWDYFDINVAGVAAYRRLRTEFDRTDWYHAPGSLFWSSDPVAAADLVARVDELRATGYPAALISRERAMELERWVRIDRSVEQVASFPDEGWADPKPMIADLVRAGRGLGLKVRWNTRVVAIEDGPGVLLSSGERLDADVVVLCCGRWSAETTNLVGFELPMIPGTEVGSLAVGLLVLAAPSVQGLRRIVIADDSMIRPDGAGRLLLHSDTHDRSVDPNGSPDALVELAGRVADEAAAHLDLPSGLSVERATLGIRSLTEDLLPAVGWLPGSSEVYLAATHSGVTLAPVLGELIASEIVGENEERLLSPFRPDRFVPAPR